MFREDQSEKVTQGENKKSLRDRAMKSLANKNQPDEAIPMFGTQPPIATTNYRTQSLFNKKKNVLTIRDFQKASANQRNSINFNNSRQSSFSNRSRRSHRQRIEKPTGAEQDDGTIENPNFSIENLRLPYHMMAI